MDTLTLTQREIFFKNYYLIDLFYQSNFNDVNQADYDDEAFKIYLSCVQCYSNLENQKYVDFKDYYLTMLSNYFHSISKENDNNEKYEKENNKTYNKKNNYSYNDMMQKSNDDNIDDMVSLLLDTIFKSTKKEEERKTLHDIINTAKKELGIYESRILDLINEGYTIAEIKKMSNLDTHTYNTFIENIRTTFKKYGLDNYI